MPRALSIDEIIDNAKKAVTPESFAFELRNIKNDLLSIPREHRRYPEVQQILRRLDDYLAKVEAENAERAASKWEYDQWDDEMGRAATPAKLEEMLAAP